MNHRPSRSARAIEALAFQADRLTERRRARVRNQASQWREPSRIAMNLIDLVGEAFIYALAFAIRACAGLH